MLLVLSKLLVLPFYPLGAVITFFLLGFLFSLMRKRKLTMIFFGGAAFALLFFSFPPVSHLLIRGLEKQYPPSGEFKTVSGVVLLGGGMEPKKPPRMFDETNCNADRILHAARVFRLSGSKYLVLSGGRIEFMDGIKESEAVSTYRLLKGLFEIDKDAFLLEPDSRSTRENALYVKKLMDKAGIKKDIHLVTSAYHMPRSVAVFKKLGFDVYPAPTDYLESEKMNRKLYALLPNAKSFCKSKIALHEYYGIITYRLLGWI
ncbi:MAG: YdcF family protein [Chitinispirillaceae bacterium]